MDTAPTLEASYCRAVSYADKLVDALNDLSDAGGARKLRGSMRAGSVERLGEQLRPASLVIGEALAELEAPPPRPARQTLLRRQANPQRPRTR